MLSQDTIDAIKRSCNTVDVVGSFLKLKKKGSDYIANCPFHDEKTPSFTISPSKNIYKCFGCGKSGDGIEFLREHKTMSFIEAIKWVGEKNNIKMEEDYKPKVYTKPTVKNIEVGEKVISYFESRKISKKTISDFKITEAKEWMPQFEAEVAVICFNYYREGYLVNTKFRGAKKAFKLVKGAELIFYNLDAIQNEDTVYITEGEIDCLSLYECGIKNCVSVPNGASVNGNIKLEYLDNCWRYFSEKSKIVLVTDNDAAGQRLKEELSRRFGFKKCFLVTYPEGCKDANDVLVNVGKEALIEMLEGATQYPLQGEITVDEMFETVLDFYENGYPVGKNCGLSNEFDEHITFTDGQLTIVTGSPGCFTKEQLVHTSKGLVEIANLQIGDKVYSYNHKNRTNEFRTVTNTIAHKTHTDKLYKIKMKDGTVIKVTENHEFFNGMEYVKIKEILLSLSKKDGK